MRPPEAHRAGSSTGRVGFVGRQAELRLLADRLAVASGGQPQVVYVEGEAGAGKSSLLSKFVGSLSDAVVVEVGGDEAEVLLSYGIIDQLQRGATTEPGTDPMAVGAWLLERLDDLQVGGRVVVLVIDDLQWIDRPSSRAVLFALRRLRADRVLTVVATRPGDLADAGWVRFVAGDGRVSRLRLRGLNPEELTEMARALGLGVLTERGASRLAVHTRGNALHCRALLDEIGAADLSAGEGELPAPRALSAVILSRIASLPAATQAFLAAASVLGQHAPLTSIRSVARWPAAEGEVDGAVAAGLLSEGVSSSELAFTHPLYRAAVYADLSPTLRRELHGRAAEILGGWPGLTHWVAAAPGPDDALAGDLEAAASAGTAEGDVGTAAWALEQAAFLSSTGEERERRLLDAAVALLNASDSAGAARILSFCESSSARLDALTGLLGVFTGSLSAENRLLAAWQAHDPRKDREIGVRAATSMANLMVIFGRPEQALTWGDRAVDGAAVGSTLWVMAQVAKASAFAAANRNPEGLSSLSFLAVPGNEVPVAETDALIMRGMLKVYADDLPGALADLGVSAARLRAGLASTYPGPPNCTSRSRPSSTTSETAT